MEVVIWKQSEREVFGGLFGGIIGQGWWEWRTHSSEPSLLGINDQLLTIHMASEAVRTGRANWQTHKMHPESRRKKMQS